MSRTIASLLLCCAIALLAPLAASAAPVTVPTGLSPGDHYRLAFITSTKRNALSTEIGDFNTFVTDDANAVPELAALGTTWTVIASTATVAAVDNTNTNPTNSVGVPIYTLADARIADNNSDLWDHEIQVPLNVLPNGEFVQGHPITDRYVFTGTSPNGISHSLALGESFVLMGLSTQTGFIWVADTPNQTQTESIELRRFYAISGELVGTPLARSRHPQAAVWLHVNHASRRSLQMRVRVGCGSHLGCSVGCILGLRELPSGEHSPRTRSTARPADGRPRARGVSAARLDKSCYSE